VSPPIPRATSARANGAAGPSSIAPLRPRRARLGICKKLPPFAVIFFLSACGVQGPPLPPRAERPEQVTDLSVIQKGRTLELSFTLPTQATDGERLTKPMDLEIFEALAPRGAAPAPLLEGAAPAMTLKPADFPRFMIGGKMVYPWKLSEKDYSNSLGETYTFAVSGVTYGFRHRARDAGLSNAVQATLLDVSGPVENLRARATENSLELVWSAPSKTLSGAEPSTLAGYRVYRSESGKPGSFALRTVTSSPAYSDKDFVFDGTYFYKVQAQFQGDHTTAESEESPAVKITPHDTFPPDTPRNVNAIYSAGSVEVVWTPSTAADLAGYNVLRSEAGGGETRINKELVRTPVFRDGNVQTGHRYFYRVTAVDLTGNESPPSRAAEVEVR
jgi:hypothetical protein